MSTRLHPDGLARCAWAWPEQIYIDYHDFEWGQAKHDNRELFEQLCLEAFQAGLSWITVLKRREGLRKAFHGFVLHKVAGISDSEIAEMMRDNSIIRNEMKIRAVVSNARLVLDNNLDLNDLLWSHSPSALPSLNAYEALTKSEESASLSRHLKSLGFKFVGPTSMYALMQSCGIIPDHSPECFLRGVPEVLSH